MGKDDILLDGENARVLADLVVDPQTSEPLRIKIITEFLANQEGQGFFKTLFEDKLSMGKCPCCDHENHWAIPEDDLNQMGWVTHEKDPRVPEITNEDVCGEYQEACKKKKIGV